MLGNKQPPNLSGLKTTKFHFLLMLNVHDRWSGEQFIKVIQQPGRHKQPLSWMLPVGVGAGRGGGVGWWWWGKNSARSHTCSQMFQPSNNIGFCAHNALVRTGWANLFLPKPNGLEMQSSNVDSIGRSGKSWQNMLVTVADSKYARKPGNMQTAFVAYISEFLPRRIIDHLSISLITYPMFRVLLY